jgi:type IX secretion system PorP/SprF family membrane protein
MNYFNKIKILLLFILLLSLSLKSQTFHFSQFHAVPMALNPALTGDMNGPYRFSANFRSQWLNGGTPYLTGALGADFHLLQKKLSEGNKWGVGFNILNDQSNGGGLQNTEVSLSSAYHIKVDEFGDQTFGLGFQGTFHERKINLSQLNFEDQFTNQGFINTLPNGEIFTDVNKKYFDINAGLIYNYRDPESGLKLFAGFSAYNILQSKVSITNLQNYRMPSRYTEHAGGIIPMSQLSDLKFSATYMQMANTTNLTVGAAWNYGLDIESATSIILGSWYRVNDALIPYVGFRNNSFQLGLTYDATTSTLKTLSQTRNAYELSLVYMPWIGKSQKGPNWY